MSELLTLRGTATAVGWMSLSSDLLVGTVNQFRIPRGLKVKLWCKRIGGTGSTTVSVSFVPDITSPTSNPLATEHLASAGELLLEKRRPIVIHSLTGLEGVGIYVEDLAAGATVWSEIDIEIEE
ncbi:MAG: hypothetical protein QXT16_08990 [Candidatus Caldarchaeum sp.]